MGSEFFNPVGKERPFSTTLRLPVNGPATMLDGKVVLAVTREPALVLWVAAHKSLEVIQERHVIRGLREINRVGEGYGMVDLRINSSPGRRITYVGDQYRVLYDGGQGQEAVFTVESSAPISTTQMPKNADLISGLKQASGS